LGGYGENKCRKSCFGIKKPGVRPYKFDPCPFLKEDQIIRMGNPPYRIEISTTISGVLFEDCYPNRIVANIGGIETPIIDLISLKTNKKAAGRYKDLNDLENLP